MQRVVIFFICILCTLVSTVQLPFTLEYKGICSSLSPIYDCTARAQSETISTVIQAHGNPLTSLKYAIGSISTWTMNGTISENGTVEERGTFTYGIHTTHETHTISYKSQGQFDINNSVCGAGWILVTDGTGTLAAAKGYLSQSRCFEEDGVSFTAWVSGFIILSD